MCVYIKMFFMVECPKAFAWSTSQCIFDCWFKYIVCNKLFLVFIGFFLYWNHIPFLAGTGFCCLTAAVTAGHWWCSAEVCVHLFPPRALWCDSFSPPPALRVGSCCCWAVLPQDSIVNPLTASPSWRSVEYLPVRFFLSLLSYSQHRPWAGRKLVGIQSNSALWLRVHLE